MRLIKEDPPSSSPPKMVAHDNDDHDDQEEAALFFRAVGRACMRGQIETLRTLLLINEFTPSNAAEVLLLLFDLYMDREVVVLEYPEDDAHRMGWAQCHRHLITIAGARVHVVHARTGESAPLGVALRMFDLRTGAAYYRERLGERPLALLTGTLTDLLLRMCQTGGVDRRHYLLTASLLRCHPGGVRVAAPLARGGRVMYALFLRQRLDWLAMHRPTDDRYVEQDLLALEPTPADVRSAVLALGSRAASPRAIALAVSSLQQLWAAGIDASVVHTPTLAARPPW